MTRYFTKTHERIEIDGDIATIGITRHAVDQLGDVVFVEHLETNGEVVSDTPISVVESTKAASEVYAPFAGEVIEVNTEIEDNPALVSEDQSETVWFFKLRILDMASVQALLDEAAYKELVG